MLKQTIVGLCPGLRLFTLVLGTWTASTDRVAGEPPAARPSAETMAAACAGCHGTFGRSQGDTPRLAGMSETDFVAAMEAFRSGKRSSSIMNRIAKGYQPPDFQAMARIFHRY